MPSASLFSPGIAYRAEGIRLERLVGSGNRSARGEMAGCCGGEGYRPRRWTSGNE
jgi:hypothetical protein